MASSSSASKGLPDLPFELWEKGWAIWSKQRKRARMAQFIIDHLRHRKCAAWIDISKGKFELCNWQELAQEWYREKERGSDITDATSMLRKGLPRAFPGLIEVKAEAVRDGTQYIKRVFQGTDPLLHDVLRCALQGDSFTEESPSSGDDDRPHAGFKPYKHATSSPSLVSRSIASHRSHPYHSSLSSVSLQPSFVQYPGVIQPPEGMYNPYAAGVGMPSYAHISSPSAAMDEAESASMLASIRASASDSTNFDSAIESTDLFSSSAQISSPAQSHPSVDSGSGSMGAPSPFPPVSFSTVGFSGLPIDIPREMYEPIVTAADMFPPSSVTSPQDTTTAASSPPEIISSPQQQQQPPNCEPQLEDLCLGVSPKRCSTAGGEPLYVFSSGNFPIPDGPITLVFFSVSLQQHRLIDLCRTNPFTYSGFVPSHPHPEFVNMHVVINGQPVLEDQFEYYDATPSLNDFLTGDVHDQLSQLHFLLGEVLGNSGGLSLLASHSQAAAASSSESGFVHHALSLMTFTAALGVSTLMRLLLQLPHVEELLKRTNEDGLLAEEVARQHGHSNMAECMQKFRERRIQSSDAAVDDLLDTLSSSQVRASACIASIALAIRKSEAQPVAASSRPQTEVVRHQAEEQCIQRIVRTHLAQVQQNQYALLANERDQLKSQCDTLCYKEKQFYGQIDAQAAQLGLVHKDRLALLKLVARWHVHGIQMYRHMQTVLRDVNKTAAKNVTLEEQKKLLTEEKEKAGQALVVLQQEKGALLKEAEMLRGKRQSGDEETAVLKEKYLEMCGLLEAAQLDLEETHKKKDWFNDEHKKVVAENRRIGESMAGMRVELEDAEKAKVKSDDECRKKEKLIEKLNGELQHLKMAHEKKVSFSTSTSVAESTPSISDSAIGSLGSQLTAESTMSELSFKQRYSSSPEMTSLKPRLTKHVSLGKARSLQDLGFQIQPAFFIQDVTVAHVEAVYREGFDRIVEINGKAIDATSVKDMEKILEKGMKKERFNLTLATQDTRGMPVSPQDAETMSASSVSSSSARLKGKQSSFASETSTSSHYLTPLTSVTTLRGSADKPSVHTPRVVVIQRTESGDLGFRLNGGNAVGLFVSATSDTAVGLKKMDQLLELEGHDLRNATMEEVTSVLREVRDHSTGEVRLLVQHNPDKYMSLREIQLDSFYVRCQTSQLRFQPKDLKVTKGDILHVTSSTYEKARSYLAWKVNLDGTEVGRGSVPNSAKAFDLCRIKSEFAIQPYQRVSLQRPFFARPIILYGERVDEVKKELLKAYPEKFCLCPLKSEYKDITEIEQMVKSLGVVEYNESEEGFACVAVDDVKSLAAEHKHCILDVSAFSIVQLQLVDLHPIVVCLKATLSSDLGVPKFVEKHQAHSVVEAETPAATCQAICEVVTAQQPEQIWLSI